MSASITFQPGEKIVFPNHGVGTIENISSRAFEGRSERFYLLRLNCSSMTVMVPFSHVGELGLRKVTRNGDVTRVLDYLSEAGCARNVDWKDRFKENSEKMGHGSLTEIAEVFKCLVVQQTRKPLSFREKKMLDRARHMLITELSISRSLSETEACTLLERTLAKACLPLPAAI
ncbi:MAG TPA: CarD family transcriptional regulator [Bryobacteraceae bacterium]|nr:CarD family transcriptional regulator [Bryobacteraceae bacterium]